MTAIVVQPDIQQLVIGFLLDQSEVTDLFDGEPPDRVYSRWPKTKTWPAVRVTQFNDQAVTRQPKHLVTTFLTVEAVGGPNKLCSDIAATCAAVLEARLIGSHDGVVVTNVATQGLRDEPDATFEPAQNRWLFTVAVTAHAVPITGS